MQSFVRDCGVEGAALLRRLGFSRSGNGPVRLPWLRAMLIHLVVLGAFGVFLPFGQGAGFLDSVVLGAYQALGVVFSAPAAAVPFERRPDFSEAVARVLTCFLYGAAMSWIMILLGGITVYSTNAIYVGPSLEVLAETGLFGVCLNIAVTAAALWLTLAHSAGAAKTLVRVVFFSLLFVFFFRSRWLPDVALTGSAIAAAAALGFFFLLYRVADRGQDDQVPRSGEQ